PGRRHPPQERRLAVGQTELGSCHLVLFLSRLHRRGGGGTVERIMRALAAVALAALAAALPAAQPLNPRPAAKTEMRVYDLGLNDPAVATEIIRGLLSAEGRVYPDPAQHRLRALAHAH